MISFFLKEIILNALQLSFKKESLAKKTNWGWAFGR